MSDTSRHEQTLKLIERLNELAPHPTLVTAANKIKRRLNAMPMSQILDKMPGSSLTGKARTLGVTRQALYYWINGVTRPDDKQAKRLAKLTGIDVDVIQGRDVAA